MGDETKRDRPRAIGRSRRYTSAELAQPTSGEALEHALHFRSRASKNQEAYLIALSFLSIMCLLDTTWEYAMAAPLKVSASVVKQSFGRVFDEAQKGTVIIEKHGRPVVAMIPIQEYEALQPAAGKTIDLLTARFDALISAMQKPEQRSAMRKAFSASSKELGKAHVSGFKKRGF
ncbi:MAG: type II toxin-antitoxin system Phd/YefM family antitoxin [Burkholderiales bacterium]